MPRVLLVEDNEANSDMLSRRLARRNWTVLIAVNGRQGVDAAVAALPDVILMDMSLPEISGWEATYMLKKLESTRSIPVIALTAHAMASDMERAIGAGCDEFETKPVDFERLLFKMSSLVSQRKFNVNHK